ncbi:MAG: hypothetical protein AB7U38_06340 [Hyphomicrobiales bacterium]
MLTVNLKEARGQSMPGGIDPRLFIAMLFLGWMVILKWFGVL